MLNQIVETEASSVMDAETPVEKFWTSFEGTSYQTWTLNGHLHRLDGPSLIVNFKDKQWYRYGKRHRTDGPAVDYCFYQTWWIDGEQIDCKSQEEFERIMKLKAFW